MEVARRGHGLCAVCRHIRCLLCGSATVGGYVATDSLDRIFAGLQLHPGDLLELQGKMQEPSALESEHASPWLRAVTAQLHTTTWMTISGTEPLPMITHRGTRPGSSWADVTFASVLRRVLDCRDQARGRRVTPQIPWDGTHDIYACGKPSCTVPLTDVIWADDISSCFEFCGPAAMKVELTSETGVIADAFQSFGMQLNFAATKTAALVAPRGPGAKQAKTALFATATLPVLREHAPGAHLPLASSYRQVGVVHQPDGSIKGELQQRLADAWMAFRQGRKRVFRNPAISMVHRFALFRSLVMSRLLYAAGSWPSLRLREARMYQAALVSMFRQLAMLKRDQGQHLHLCELCALVGSATPAAPCRKTALFAPAFGAWPRRVMGAHKARRFGMRPPAGWHSLATRQGNVPYASRRARHSLACMGKVHRSTDQVFQGLDTEGSDVGGHPTAMPG